MNAIAILYFIVACNLGSINSAKHEDSCEYLGINLYEDIGCKAVYSSNKTCPERYSCPNNKNDPNICYQGGNRYYEGEKINSNRLTEFCLSKCTCKSGYKQGKIICDYIDCPSIPTTKEGCYYQSKPFECCGTEEFCEGEKTTQSPITCEYDGKVYSDGQYFRPINTCLDCYCSKGFDGKLEKPYCREATSLADIYDQSEIKRKCGPQYYLEENTKDSSLCAISNFICQEDIIEATYITRGPKTTEGKCAFNGGYYNKEDSLNVTFAKRFREESATCSCRLPPLMTCITTYSDSDDDAKKRSRSNPISKKQRSN